MSGDSPTGRGGIKTATSSLSTPTYTAIKRPRAGVLLARPRPIPRPSPLSAPSAPSALPAETGQRELMKIRSDFCKHDPWKKKKTYETTKPPVSRRRSRQLIRISNGFRSHAPSRRTDSRKKFAAVCRKPRNHCPPDFFTTKSARNSSSRSAKSPSTM